MFAFYIHQEIPRWRLVLREGDAFPSETAADEWRLSRVREDADTNADVRVEVERRGYCLFAITAEFAELDRDRAQGAQ